MRKDSFQELIEPLRIDKVVFRGYGLGHHAGLPVFVPFTLPGDVIRCRIDRKTRSLWWGQVDSVLEPSPYRQESGCEVFGVCGGCDWLHADYRDQTRFKQEIISEFLTQLGVSSGDIPPIIAAEEETHYRNKSFLPIGLHDRQPVIGMFARMSHQVIPHQNCLLQPVFFDKIAATVLDYIQKSGASIYDESTGTGALRHLGIRYEEVNDEVVVVLVTRIRKLPFTKQLVRMLLERFPTIVGIVQNINKRPVNNILGEDEKILWGRSHLFTRLGHLTLKVHYKSFFQVHHQQTERLYQEIRQLIAPGSRVVDAFSGIGSIGLYIADVCEHVWCVERNENADIDARENCRINDIDNCTTICGQVEDEIPKLCRKNRIDTIIFDPPRRGLQPQTLEIVTTTGIPRIIYISCNPSTQVRDARQIIDSGYQITSVQPLDMFPQTYHIENIIVFDRIETDSGSTQGDAP